MEALHVAVLHGAPRLDVHQVDFTFFAQPSMRGNVNSGPLSERRFSGCRRFSISQSKARVTRPLPRLVSAFNTRHSLVKASTTLRMRTMRPFASPSTSRVEHQRRATLLPPDSDARLPNRTCTFRYASGSPGTPVYAGVRIHPLRKRSTRSMERRNCSTLPSRHSLRVGRRRLGSRTSLVLLRWRFLCFFISQRQMQSPT
jgi:hypothetical protein